MSRTAHARKPAAEKRALCRDLVGKRVELLHDMHLRKAMLCPRGTRRPLDDRPRLRKRVGDGRGVLVSMTFGDLVHEAHS